MAFSMALGDFPAMETDTPQLGSPTPGSEPPPETDAS
jgi:hypothetical protein